MVDLSGDSTDKPVDHAYGSNLVTRTIFDGGSDLDSIERRDGRHHRGGVFEHVHVARHKVREAPGGQEHRQPLRRASDGVLDLRQLARSAGLQGVRDEGEGCGDADEDDERAGTRHVLRRLCAGGGPGLTLTLTLTLTITPTPTLTLPLSLTLTLTLKGSGGTAQVVNGGGACV